MIYKYSHMKLLETFFNTFVTFVLIKKVIRKKLDFSKALVVL